LIVTADDFGLSQDVNVAIEEAHRRGILSAASLMVAGAAATDAIARARRMPSLRVGLHLVIADGDPLSERACIPGLLDGNGRLRTDLARFGAQLWASTSLKRQLGKEIAAQFAAFGATGLPLDHVNGHRHFHIHPAVSASIMEIGPRYGMRALRVPVEPRRILAAIDPQTPRHLGFTTAPWAALLRNRARRVGLKMADAVFGLAWTGAMTRQRLAALIARLPPGLVEIYLHPAATNDFPGAAKGYTYVEEFAALCDGECAAALRRSGYTTGGYLDALPPR
jgi:hopanoid biosynthesis associated protein HpnK